MAQIGAQQSPQGIAALSMGNPAPLQQRIQRGGKDPQTGLPNDLADALALNIVTNETDAAKRATALQQLQQAMGPTGQMPTVVQGLQQQAQQKMQAAQQHAMQMAQAQQAGQGQGIDHAPVEFGMAGGGIISFANTGSVPSADDVAEKRKMALDELVETMPERMPEGREGSLSGYLQARKSIIDEINRLYPERIAPEAQAAYKSVYGRPMQQPTSAVQQAAPTDNRAALNAVDSAVYSSPTPTPQPIRDLRQAANQQAQRQVQQGAPRETMDPMEKAIRDNIMKTMGLSEDAEYSKGVDRFNKTVGIDALLKDMTDRATAREARFEKAKAERMPDWVHALQAMSGAPVRGGLGMMLGQMGAGAARAREAYGAEDLAFSKEIDTLRDAVTKAKLEGNIKAANAGELALKDLIANKRQAEQSGTSLLNTQEQIRARRQLAADAAAARAEGKADKTDSAYREQAMKLAMAAAVKEKASPANMVKYRDIPAETLAASMFDHIYNALKTGKMSVAPGGTSPGGTSTSGWGKASVVTP